LFFIWTGASATVAPAGSDTVPVREVRSLCAETDPTNASEQIPSVSRDVIPPIVALARAQVLEKT
jgi:hypothetical protein